MADEATASATPPATSGGLSKDDVLKIVGEALSPVTGTLKELAAGQKTLAESLSKVPAPTKPEDVAKLVTDQLAAHNKAQQEATAKNEVKAAARKKIVDTQLKGVPESFLKLLPDTEDEKILAEAAAAIRKDVQALPGVKLPDVGGATADGGTTPSTQAPAKAGGGFLKMAVTTV